jgi:phage terminase Nu1 subunit (DNA packaging protein)
MAQTSAKVLASLFGITRQRIHQLVKEGMPKENRGSYDLLKCIRWYVRFLTAAIEKKEIPVGDVYVGEREERIRNIRADADLKELDLAQKRSQLVAIQDAERVFADLRLTTTAHLMAIPPRLAPELVGETSRVMIQAKLDKACKEVLGYQAKSGQSKYGDKRAG